MPRAAFQPPPGRSPVVPASESPEFTAATTGAATTAGTMPEELAAALASGSASWIGRLAEKGALDAIGQAHAKPVRAGSNPPRFRR